MDLLSVPSSSEVGADDVRPEVTEFGRIDSSCLPVGQTHSDQGGVPILSVGMAQPITGEWGFFGSKSGVWFVGAGISIPLVSW